MGAKSDLKVISEMRDLVKYVILIANKAPKHFRFTLADRVTNVSLEALELMLMANDVFVSKDTVYADMELRLSYQREALRKLRVLEVLLHIGVETHCFLVKQFEHSSLLIVAVVQSLQAWHKSDRLRIEKFKT